MKQCTRCEKDRNKSDFSKNGTYNGKIRYSKICKVCCNKKAKEWRLSHIEDNKIYQQDYYKRFPWMKSYKRAWTRCYNDPNSAYFQRGIKMLMTPEDFRFLWDRDNASSMIQPSIDRKDGNKNYVRSNCRYMELVDNKRRSRKIGK